MTLHNAEMNVTPFLDIMLVLLVMFMVISIPELRPRMEVQLPDPDPHGTGAPVIILEVGPQRRYAINTAPVRPEELKQRIVAIYLGRPDKTLLVHGARDATYQEVMTAMDVAKGAGVKVLGIDRERGRPSRDPSRDHSRDP